MKIRPTYIRRGRLCVFRAWDHGCVSGFSDSTVRQDIQAGVYSASFLKILSKSCAPHSTS